jgi:septal ring-binding cell division protein DamX/type II secretory pathway predicted ATPase ExeA
VSDSNEFFSTPAVNAHLDLIRHLIENSELVPLVRGSTGIGKSLLASQLQKSAPDNWVVCHFSAEPTLQPERLLAFIARCSGVSDIEGDLMQRLSERFELLRKRGKTPVLLVDDAQMLPPTSLITLLRLFERQHEGVRLVSIVLFADEQIDLLLSTPQLQVMTPQAIQAIDMPVLTRAEATAFMNFLLSSEGLTEQFKLDESKLNRLYKDSGGVPGRLATAILSEVGQQSVAEQPFFSGYRKQFVLIGLPMVLVILLLLLQEPINALFQPAPEIRPQIAPAVVETESNEITFPAPEAVTEHAIQESVTPIESESVEADAGDLMLETASEKVQPQQPGSDISAEDAVDEAIEERKQSIAAEPLPMESSPLSSTSSETDQAATPVVDETEPVLPVAAAVDSAKASVSTVVENSSGSVAEVASQPIANSTEVLGKKPESQPELTAETTQNIPAAADTQLETLTENSAESAPVNAVSAQNDSYSRATEWVESQPPQNYTLQLVAVENISSLKRFIKKYNLDNHVFTVKTQRKGAPWYALILGSFENRAQAKAAEKKLPTAVQKSGVWTRTFASLRASVKK